MGIIPLAGGPRGAKPSPSTGGGRDETIQRVWRFAAGIIASAIRLTTGASAGKLATSDADGNLVWGTTLPSQHDELIDQNTSAIGTVATSVSGEYMVGVYVEVTTAGAAGTLDASLTVTDDAGSSAIPLFTGLSTAATGGKQGIAMVRCASGQIDYTITQTGGAGTVWRVYANAVKLR